MGVRGCPKRFFFCAGKRQGLVKVDSYSTSPADDHPARPRMCVIKNHPTCVHDPSIQEFKIPPIQVSINQRKTPQRSFQISLRAAYPDKPIACQNLVCLFACLIARLPACCLFAIGGCDRLKSAKTIVFFFALPIFVHSAMYKTISIHYRFCRRYRFSIAFGSIWGPFGGPFWGPKSVQNRCQK